MRWPQEPVFPSGEAGRSLVEQVRRTIRAERATAAAVCVMASDRVLAYWHEGFHPLPAAQGLPRQGLAGPGSRFNVYSVRKAFIGLAVASAMCERRMEGPDAPVGPLVGGIPPGVLEGVTLRHLLTHTHGVDFSRGEWFRRFRPGTGWHYTNAGVDLLTRAFSSATGETVAEAVARRVFRPCGFTQTGWEEALSGELVADVQPDGRQALHTLGGASGTDRNLYASARELALWGRLHLRSGRVAQGPALPAEAFSLATEVLTPASLPRRLPRNGFFWWIQEDRAALTEIGGRVPAGSYQIVGMGGAVCLVMPALDAVAVRLCNSLARGAGSVLRVREFGNLAARLAARQG